MASITRGRSFKVEMALWESVRHIEEEAKTKWLFETTDVNALALKCFEQLEKEMKPYAESDTLFATLFVSGVKKYFGFNSLIAKDLQKYKELQNSKDDPKMPFTSTWRALCQPQQKTRVICC